MHKSLSVRVIGLVAAPAAGSMLAVHAEPARAGPEAACPDARNGAVHACRDRRGRPVRATGRARLSPPCPEAAPAGLPAGRRAALDVEFAGMVWVENEVLPKHVQRNLRWRVHIRKTGASAN